MPTAECPKCGTWLEVADKSVCDPLRCPQCNECFPLFDLDDTKVFSQSPEEPDAMKMPQ
jgi:hypothetical protein